MSAFVRFRNQLISSLSVLLCTTIAGQVSAQTLYTESFTSGLDTMTPVAVCGVDADWFPEAACADSAGAPSPPDHAAAHAAAGDCTLYGDGDVSTALESPAVDVSTCSGGLVLTFDYLIDFQEDFEFDRARVEFDLDSGGFTQIATNPGPDSELAPTCAGAPPVIGNLVQDGAWHTVSLSLADLSAAPASTATVRFLLETGDDISNDGQGFFVDDVEVVCLGVTDLSLTKSDSIDPVAAGANLTYTLTAFNAGPDASTGATITDVLPAGLSFVSSATGCSEEAGTVTCAVGPLAAGASEVHSFVATVDPSFSGTLANSATVVGFDVDPVAANQAFEATTVAGFDPVAPFGGLIYEADYAVAYSATDSTEAGGPAFDFEDISGSGTSVVLEDDEVSIGQSLGFNFEFFGVDYSDVFISSNGFLSFLPGPDDGCCDGVLLPTLNPGNDDPNAIVAAWWTDLDPEEGGTIHTQTLGAAPNRRFIVQFTDIEHIEGGDPVTFQVKLFESSGDVEAHYLEAPTDGFDHTAGVEDATGTSGLTYFFGTDALPTPLAVRYRPSVDSAAAFSLDAGQTVTVVADPSAALSPTIQLEDPASAVIGSATAAAGADAVIQTVTVDTAGTYTVRTGANRSGDVGTEGTTSTGALGVRVILNAATEAEAHDGASNDTRATAQAIDATMIDVGAGVLRGAVVGDGGDDTATVLDADDFESGSLGGQWTTSSSEPEGRIRVTGAFGTGGGAFAMLMDRTPRGAFNLNEAIWTVDLTGASTALLRFAHAAFDDDPDPFGRGGGPFVGSIDADGIAISEDGVTWFPIFSPPIQPDGLWLDYTLDLAAAATDAGIALGAGFQIKFQQYNDTEVPTDGRGWDEIEIVEPSIDFYSFDLDEGEIVTLATATSDGLSAGLELQDVAGTVLASSVAGASNLSQVISDFVVPQATTYFARVDSGSSDYSLIITRGAAFSAEPNDDLATAQDIGSTGKVLGYLETHGLFVFEISSGEILELDPETGAVVNSFPSPVPPGMLVDPADTKALRKAANRQAWDSTGAERSPIKSRGGPPGGGIPGPEGPPDFGLATTPTTLLAGGFGLAGIVELDPATGAVLRNLPSPVDISGIAFLNDEIFLLEGALSSDIIVLDYVTGAVLRTISAPPVFFGLGASSTTLLGTSFDELYSINPTTGATSLLGTVPTIELDSLGLGVIGDELFIADVFEVEVFDLATLTQLRTLTEFGPLFGLGADGEGISEADVYSLTLTAGTTLMLSTLTPGDDPLDFANDLDPALELYDPSDALVAADDNSGADGRNAELTHVALTTGTYKVRVIHAGGGGEYLLQTSADLALGKTDSPDPVIAGTNLTYAIDLINNGPGAATATTVTAPVPAGTAFVSAAVPGGSGWAISAPVVGATGDVVFSKALVGGGEIASFELVVAVGPGTPAGTVVAKTATVATASDDLDAGNDTAATTTTVAAEADLAITKSDSPDPVIAGNNLTYTLTVTNAGPSNSTDGSITDVLPAGVSFTSSPSGCTELGGTVTCPLAAIAASGNQVSTFVVTVDPGQTAVLSNAATVTGNETDPVAGNNTSPTVTTTVQSQADLAVTKTDGVTTAVPGISLIYTIVASNAGPSDEPAASLTDTFPAELTCSYTSVAAGGATGNTAAGAGDLAETLALPAGSSVTYTATCAIDPAATGTLSNTATIIASVTDPAAGNNSATDSDTVLTPQADLGVTKTDGVTSAVPGESLAYTIVASNIGPSADPAASLTDTFPAGLTCTFTSVAAGGATGNTAAGAGDLAETLALPVGGSVTYTADCAIDPAATGTLSNTASVAASVTDPVPGNNSATDEDTVLTPEADLGVTKSDSVDPVAAGTGLTYTITVTNAGPSDATNVIAADTLPAGVTLVSTTGCTEDPAGLPVCSLGTIPTGGSAMFTVDVAVDTATIGVITNNASVDSDAVDPDSANNSTSEDTTVIAVSDIVLTKTDDLTGANPGDEVTYTIIVTKAGPSNAPGTEVSDVFPAALTGVTWTCTATPGSTCTAAGTGDIADVIDLEAGGAATYLATGTIDADFVGTLENSATATPGPNVTDTDPSNNTDTDTTAVTSPAEVSGTMVVGASRSVQRGGGGFAVGDTVIYTVTLMNSSPTAQLDNPGPEFVNELPTELTLLAASADSGIAAINATTNTATWDGVIPASGLVVITLEARIDYGAEGSTITNQGTILYDADGDGTNEATALTDDPSIDGVGDPTIIVVLGIVDIPTLGQLGMLLLALGLAWRGLRTLRAGRRPDRDDR